jgi:hypothetical protein
MKSDKKNNRKAPVKLKYVGNGHVWLAGVPPRDLTQDEIDMLGVAPAVLMASGLYEQVESTQTPEHPSIPPERADAAVASGDDVDKNETKENVL